MMDIFQTTVTSCILISTFLVERASYSTQSKSLAARFKWDARVVQGILDYFSTRANDSQLSAEDADLLTETSLYLHSLVDRLRDIEQKLTAKTRWSKEVNKALWPFRKSEIVELEAELFEWTQRLDLRLLALPEQLRDGILPLPATEYDQQGNDRSSHLTNSPLNGISNQTRIPITSEYAPALASQRQIERYLHKNRSAREISADNLWIQDYQTRISFPDFNPARFVVAEYCSRSVIVEHRPFASHLQHNGPALDALRLEVAEFAAALANVDPQATGICRCIGLFEEMEPPHFGLVHELHGPIGINPPTLKDLISKTDDAGRRLLPAHPLNQRLELARRLSVSVLFIHSLGWVHKSIRSGNVLVIENQQTINRKPFPRGLGDPFLMGFQFSRDADGNTDPRLRPDIVWEEEIYQHPDRQGALKDHSVARFSMAHDIYSLGVVLLEIGLWRPLEKYATKLVGASPLARHKFLLKLAEESDVIMGKKYKDLVLWCLQIDVGALSNHPRYSVAVIEVLEELAAALT